MINKLCEDLEDNESFESILLPNHRLTSWLTIESKLILNTNRRIAGETAANDPRVEGQFDGTFEGMQSELVYVFVPIALVVLIAVERVLEEARAGARRLGNCVVRQVADTRVRVLVVSHLRNFNSGIAGQQTILHLFFNDGTNFWLVFVFDIFVDVMLHFWNNRF